MPSEFCQCDVAGCLCHSHPHPVRRSSPADAERKRCSECSDGKHFRCKHLGCRYRALGGSDFCLDHAALQPNAEEGT